MGKIRKGVAFEEKVYQAVKLLAEQEGKSVSEIVNTAVKSFLDNSEHAKTVRNLADYLYLAELYEIAGEIAGKKLALETLTKLEELVRPMLRDATLNVVINRIKAKLTIIFQLMDQVGKDFDYVLETAGYVVEDLKEEFNKLGLTFNLEEFANECWLHDIPIEEWLKPKLSNVDPVKLFEAVKNII